MVDEEDYTAALTLVGTGGAVCSVSPKAGVAITAIGVGLAAVEKTSVGTIRELYPEEFVPDIDYREIFSPGEPEPTPDLSMKEIDRKLEREESGQEEETYETLEEP